MAASAATAPPTTAPAGWTQTFSIVPEDTQKAFPAPGEARFAVVEKLRHGRFFNIGGVMPLYSLEALSDQDVADLLAYLGL